MNKSIYGLVMSLIISLAMPAYGQDFYAGLAGGLNVANLKITFADPTIRDYETNSKTLFGVGGFFGVAVNEYLSVQCEPMYVAKGGVHVQRNVPEMTIRSSQLDVALVAKAGIGEEVRPFIAVGPFMSVLFDANTKVELAGREWEGDLMQALKRTEYGIVFGAGVGIPVWKGSVFVEGRYALGLTNVNKGGSFDLKHGAVVADRITTDPNDEIKTRGILIMIGYQLPLGGISSE
jgi:hypothetical protein